MSKRRRNPAFGTAMVSGGIPSNPETRAALEDVCAAAMRYLLTLPMSEQRKHVSVIRREGVRPQGVPEAPKAV
jgi:hypothetical protein